jgi:TIR domain-containing protein/HEAT repeat protein
MPWRVFYSYSHMDRDLRERLGTYLAPLKQQHKISEWYDRKIEPGANWESEIAAQLNSADLILLLVSADFLASEYCFGVEVEQALGRLKRGEVKVVPVLLKPCLWKESRFSELQTIPRDAKAITSWPSVDEALNDVASELRGLVSEPPPVQPTSSSAAAPQPHRFDTSLDLVRGQIRSYARLYERTRQRMQASSERTQRMEQIFQKMCGIATASYPLLDELADSPSPGERLAAVAILQAFAADRSIPFLVKLIGSEKPFVGYHAAKALRFAAGAMDPSVYPQLLNGIHEAQAALTAASVGHDTDRQTVLRAAEQELRESIAALAAPAEKHD